MAKSASKDLRLRRAVPRLSHPSDPRACEESRLRLQEALLEEVRALKDRIEAVEEDNRRLLERLVAGPQA